MLCQLLYKKLCSKELSDPVIKLISSQMQMLSFQLFPRMVAFGSKGLLLSGYVENYYFEYNCKWHA